MKENPAVIRSVKIVIAILYVVGVLGFSFEATYPLFVFLTPVNLLLTTILLLFFQQTWSVKTALILAIVALIGFVTELVGVNTGLLFGEYEYGPALGVQLLNTPLLIGINWLILAYGVFVLFRKINLRWYFPLVGALLMVAFDFVMEPVATALNMWSWETEQIPLKNYVDWYLVSVLIFALMRATRLQLNNRLAVWILLVQFVFFLGLNIILKLT